jgi:endo-1,4-beta-xylanase
MRVHRPNSPAWLTLAAGPATALGVLLDGLGFQAHLALGYGCPATLEENLRRFSGLGLDTALAEVDVRMQLPADDAKPATQAAWCWA